MDNVKVAVIGANGQLGTDIIKILNQDSFFELFPLTHYEIEITDEYITRKVLDAIAPDIVINTSAFHRVDDCETNIDKAFTVNTIAQKRLAEYCSEKNQTIVYISTDYVFGLDSERNMPYSETDRPGPLNVYGLSKLTGEYFTQYIANKHFIVRSCGLYGEVESSVKRGNFVETMLKLAKEKKQIRVVDDQTVSPTYTLDLAKQIHRIIKTENYGLYHASAHGQCTWYDFAREIFNLTHTTVDLIPVKTSEFQTPARRPRYSVLDNSSLKKLDLDIMVDWQTGLKQYLTEKKYI